MNPLVRTSDCMKQSIQAKRSRDRRRDWIKPKDGTPDIPLLQLHQWPQQWLKFVARMGLVSRKINVAAVKKIAEMELENANNLVVVSLSQCPLLLQAKQIKYQLC